MNGQARTIQLTEAGYRITDLMRAGVVPQTGVDRTVIDGAICPVCRWWVASTATGTARPHLVDGRHCYGIGRRVR